MTDVLTSTQLHVTGLTRLIVKSFPRKVLIKIIRTIEMMITLCKSVLAYAVLAKSQGYNEHLNLQCTQAKHRT